eukprot:s397_g57.t1
MSLWGLMARRHAKQKVHVCLTLVALLMWMGMPLETGKASPHDAITISAQTVREIVSQEREADPNRLAWDFPDCSEECCEGKTASLQGIDLASRTTRLCQRPKALSSMQRTMIRARFGGRGCSL